jgi:hypothetical protein
VRRRPARTRWSGWQEVDTTEFEGVYEDVFDGTIA